MQTSFYEFWNPIIFYGIRKPVYGNIGNLSSRLSVLDGDWNTFQNSTYLYICPFLINFKDRSLGWKLLPQMKDCNRLQHNHVAVFWQVRKVKYLVDKYIFFITWWRSSSVNDSCASGQQIPGSKFVRPTNVCFRVWLFSIYNIYVFKK